MFQIIIIIYFLIAYARIHGILYSGKYFEIKDRLKAECVRKNNFANYNYLGNRDSTISGRKCEKWNDVFTSWFEVAETDQKILAQTFEQFHHSKCRSVVLPSAHPMYSIEPPIITDGKMGPWCFIKMKNGYKPESCFNACNESKIVVPHIKRKDSSLGYISMKLNYNQDLIDQIDRMFSSYNWGDEKYYNFLPSKEHPPEYLKLRWEVFHGLCAAFFFVLFWLLICFMLRKRAARIHHQREKVLESFYKDTNLDDIRIKIELDRESVAN